jgi:hypothetical protein
MILDAKEGRITGRGLPFDQVVEYRLTFVASAMTGSVYGGGAIVEAARRSPRSSLSDRYGM